MITPEMTESMERAGLGRRAGWMLICILVILAGAAAFLVGVFGDHPERAWQAYLVNFVFWVGVASGGVMFSAVLIITDARWGRPLKRLAESMGAFLPVACVLFWALYFGREHLFHWIHDPLPEKAAWLNAPFLFLRNGMGLVLLTLVGAWLISHSIRVDRGSARGADASTGASTRAQKRLAPLYGVLYAFALTILAFDLMMSLEPHWYSTLFGAWYFMGSFYTALAALVLLLAFGVRSMGMGLFVRGRQYLGLGQLMLGFCLITGDFFYVHLMIMWYGNIPEESVYVLTRMRQDPWPPLTVAAMVCCYAIPFGVLLSRGIKYKTVPMVILAAVILGGIWMERMMLVAPAIWRGDTLPIGIPEALITAGFAGMLFLCVLLFLARYPVLPLRDPMFLEVVEQFEGEEQER